MQLTENQEIVYRIDADGKILSVSSNWDEFYQRNVPESSNVPTFVGTNLWDHISDSTTVHIYGALIAQSHQLGRELVIDFRCDAPASRRQMQMHVKAVEEGHVEFRSVTLSEEARTPVDLLDLRVRYSSDLIHTCGWCNKVLLSEWCEIEEAVQKLQIFQSTLLPRITHTICPTCAEGIRRQIAGYRRQ